MKCGKIETITNIYNKVIAEKNLCANELANIIESAFQQEANGKLARGEAFVVKDSQGNSKILEF